MRIRQILRLSAANDSAVRFYSESVSLSDASKTIKVTVTRTGQFSDPRYGTFDITLAMLQEMKRNFEANTYGQDIVLDLSHEPAKGAAGFFRSLAIEPYTLVIEGRPTTGHKLLGQVELTEFGMDAIRTKGFVYLSAEFHPEFVSNETGKTYGAVLQGAALTPRPVIKHLDRVQLSERSLSSNTTLIDAALAAKLHEENTMKFAALLASLKAKLATLKLSSEAAASFFKLAETMLTGTDDEAIARQLMLAVESQAVTLSEAGLGNAVVNLDTTALVDALTKGEKALSEEQINALLDKRLKKLADDQAAKDAVLVTKRKLFDDAVKATEGLDDAALKSLAEAAELITADTPDDQIRRLAAREIKHAQELVAARKLGVMGMSVNTPLGRIQLTDSPITDGLKLQALQHEKLKLSREFQTGQLKLAEKVPHFVEDTLRLFDAQHAHELTGAINLANGLTGVSDTSLPIGYQREVIREALSDLNVLSLVATATDPGATATTNIPYELRGGEVLGNDGIVAERQPIPKTSVKQMMDIAYVNAMKLAIDVSNEVMHFTRSSGINWDAWARNIASAARIMREILARRIANMLQRVSDSYNAVAVTGESIQSQVNGSGAIVKTAQFPIVAPYQIKDLQGNNVGSVQNPIIVSVNGAAVAAYDGSGTQSAGTYYRVINHNLGYIQFVNQAGAAAAPNHTSGATTISYSYATNILKVSSDIPNGVTREVHNNKLIQAFGARKAMMSSQRFVTADFALMSPTLNNDASDAELFSAHAKRKDGDISTTGDLEPIKGIPSFQTNAPDIHLGDERILMGQRGVASYTIVKPWSMGEMVEARDAQGRLIGAKECYGEEYNALHVPLPLRNRFTSILWYSATNR